MRADADLAPSGPKAKVGWAGAAGRPGGNGEHVREGHGNKAETENTGQLGQRTAWEPGGRTADSPAFYRMGCGRGSVLAEGALGWGGLPLQKQTAFWGDSVVRTRMNGGQEPASSVGHTKI